MKPTQKDLIDTDGENRAVRAFLLGREVGCKDYEQMRRHMTNSGFDNCWPSEFASLGGHMSKAAQQMWLRHLFALERFGAGGGEPVAFVHWPLSGAPRLVWYGYKALNAAILKAYEGHQPDMLLYTHPSPTDLRAEYLRGLDDAKKIASNYGPSRPIVTNNPSQRVVGRWEGEQAASAGIADAIEALKGKQ